MLCIFLGVAVYTLKVIKQGLPENPPVLPAVNLHLVRSGIS